MSKITAFFKKIHYNSPVILTFTLLAFVAWLLSVLAADAELGEVNSWTNTHFFSVYRSSLANPLFYVRLFGHALGHANIGHFFNNFLLILLAGPMLEEKYGSRNMLFMILFTSAVTGAVFVIFFPKTMLLGASGIVFMLILLSSYVNLQRGRIPLTLILCIVVFLGREIVNGVFEENNIANTAHIAGGACGAVFGYFVNRKALRGGH